MSFILHSACHQRSSVHFITRENSAQSTAFRELVFFHDHIVHNIWHTTFSAADLVLSLRGSSHYQLLALNLLSKMTSTHLLRDLEDLPHLSLEVAAM